MTGALKPLELAWRGINRTRRALYRRGWLAQRALPRMVISVGNLAVGGSGKTPATIAVARLLQKHGLRVAVLTRGYGRTSGEEGILATPGDPARFGDEPALLAAKLPGVAVIVGRDRFASGSAYLRSGDCDVFLLDDGFQHLGLARDLDIVIDDAAAKWRREGPAALRSADVVLVRDGSPEPGAYPPAFGARLVAVNADGYRGRAVFAFCGIANPERFFETVRGLGVALTGSRAFPDHHWYTPAEIAALRAASGPALLLTTEKDLVKLPGQEGISAVEVEMRIEPAEEFEQLLLAEVRAHLSG